MLVLSRPDHGRMSLGFPSNPAFILADDGPSGTGGSETRTQIGRHRHWRVEVPASGAETLLVGAEGKLAIELDARVREISLGSAVADGPPTRQSHLPQRNSRRRCQNIDDLRSGGRDDTATAGVSTPPVLPSSLTAFRAGRCHAGVLTSPSGLLAGSAQGFFHEQFLQGIFRAEGVFLEVQQLVQAKYEDLSAPQGDRIGKGQQ